jgi:hypothetical protein
MDQKKGDFNPGNFAKEQETNPGFARKSRDRVRNKKINEL